MPPSCGIVGRTRGTAAGYATGRGGGRLSKASPKRRRGGRPSSTPGRLHGDAALAGEAQRAGCGLLRVPLVVGEPAPDGAPGHRAEHGEHREHRQRRGVQPRREERPAAADGTLGVRLHEVDRGGEGEERRPRAAARARVARAAGGARRTEQTERGPLGRAGANDAPGEPGEQQRERRSSRPRAGSGSSRRPRSRARRRAGRGRRDGSGCGRRARRRARAGRTREPSRGADVGAPVAWPDTTRAVHPAAEAAPQARAGASASAEEGERVAGARLAVEAEEQDALPLAETEPAGLERDLLGARAEQGEHDPLARRGRAGDEALEKRLDVAEEAGLALADPDERARRRRRSRTRCRARRAPTATSREISFVMSKTDRVGSAAATECGISTDVISPPPPAAAGSVRPRVRR